MATALASSATFESAVRYCTSCLAIYRTDFERCPLDGGTLALGAQDPLVGTFVGDYVIEDKIGEGGMGRVYRAHRMDDTSKKVALKVLLGDLAASNIMRQRFAREAEAARQLAHPNIVGVLDFGHTMAGLPFLVMDLIEGTNLAVILQKGPMPGERVIRIARQLCDGLHHAHSRGVIHRDFKPDNILIVDEGDNEEVRIADFGLALSSSNETRLTMTGVACTPAYAAPEQLRGQTIDARVDLYALGTTMFEMLTGGMLPFESDLQGTIRMKLAGEAPSLTTIVPDMQPALATLVGRLLSHDAERRPRSAKSLAVALDAALRAPKRKIRTTDLAQPLKAPAVSFPPAKEPVERTDRIRKQSTYSGRTLAVLAVGAMMVGAALAMILRDGGITREDAEDTANVTMQVVATPIDMASPSPPQQIAAAPAAAPVFEAPVVTVSAPPVSAPPVSAPPVSAPAPQAAPAAPTLLAAKVARPAAKPRRLHPLHRVRPAPPVVPTDDAASQPAPANQDSAAPQNPDAVIERMPSAPPRRPAGTQDPEGILP